MESLLRAFMLGECLSCIHLLKGFSSFALGLRHYFTLKGITHLAIPDSFITLSNTDPRGFPVRSNWSVQIRVTPVVRVRLLFMVAGAFAQRILIVTGRQLVGLIRFDPRTAAVFVRVGRWLHDTPPIFQTG